VQQHLVALAVNLQIAQRLIGSDARAAETALDELGRDVQRTLDETAQLAQRIYPPLLEAGGLAIALRSAAASLDLTVSVDVVADEPWPGEAAPAVYWCCLDALVQAGAPAHASIKVRDDEATIVFEIATEAGQRRFDLERLRDRVEALDGRLAVGSPAGGGTLISGVLPLYG
jgi:signal transduction histidine kinase